MKIREIKEVSFKVHGTELEGSDDIALMSTACLAQVLMVGDFDLLIGNENYGVEDCYVMELSKGLVRAISHIHFFGGWADIPVSETDIRIRLTHAAHSSVFIEHLYTGGRIKMESVSLAGLTHKIGACHRGILKRAFAEHPALAQNSAFVSEYPFAWDVLEERV